MAWSGAERLAHLTRLWRESRGDQSFQFSSRARRLLGARDAEAMQEVLHAYLSETPLRPGLPVPPSDFIERALVDHLCDRRHFASANQEVDVSKAPAIGSIVEWLDLAVLLDEQKVVSDEIVNAFGELLERKYAGTIGFFSSHYLSGKLAPRIGHNLSREREAERLARLATCRFFFFPVHTPDHWSFLVADCIQTCLYYFNSYGHSWATVKYHVAYSQGNVTLADNLGHLLDGLATLFPTQGWNREIRIVDASSEENKMQSDGSSCALYVMHTMEILATDDGRYEAELELPTWDDARFYLRVHVALSILSKYVANLATNATGFIDDDLSEDLMSEEEGSGDERSALTFGQPRCANCASTTPRFICHEWAVHFCNHACQKAYARRK